MFKLTSTFICASLFLTGCFESSTIVAVNSSSSSSSAVFSSSSVISMRTIQRTAVPVADRKIIGYYPGWVSARTGLPFSPTLVNYSKWQRVNYAFFQTALDGGIHGTDRSMDAANLFGQQIDSTADTTQIDTATWARFSITAMEGTINESSQNLAVPVSLNSWFKKGTGIIDVAHKAGAEVYISVGGATLSSNFPAMAAQATSRTKFASECARLIRQYNLDGIDIDWEYPGYSTHLGTPSDKGNFNLLVHEIRDSLDSLGAQTGRHFGLTAALPCGAMYLSAGFNVPDLDILDELNLMTYDLHGTWDTKSYHHTSLFTMYGDPTSSVAGCALMYTQLGAKANKINIGAAFYGAIFKGADSLKSAFGGASTSDPITGGNNYNDILPAIQSGALTEIWDDSCQAAYALWPGANGLHGGMVSYDNPRSAAAKARYIKQAGFKGIIVWDMSGDVMPDGSTPILDSLQLIKSN